MTDFLPEGELIKLPSNALHTANAAALEDIMKKGIIAEGICTLCDSNHNLIVNLGFAEGFIPRNEGAIGIEEGVTRDIALISRVNKPVCFVVKRITTDSVGKPQITLSRKEAQEKCMENYITKLKAGDIIAIQFGNKEEKVEVLDVQETVKKEEAKELFRYI